MLTTAGVCLHMLLSFVVGRYLDGVWGVVWGYMGDIYPYLMYLWVPGGLSEYSSLAEWIIHTVFVKPQRAGFVSPDHNETLKYQNVHM